MPKIPDLIKLPANSKIEPLLPVAHIEIRRGALVILSLPRNCPSPVREELSIEIGRLAKRVFIIEGSFGIYILEEARQ